jgi:arylsulfatase
MKIAAWIAVLVAASTSLFCSRDRVDSPTGCLLIVLDAAAAGHFGAYGGSGSTTPNIDRLAQGGVLFERVYSQGASTNVSVPSYFQGLYPSTIIHRRAAAESGEVPTIAKLFGRAGFQTAGFSGNPWVSESFGARMGFERFIERSSTSPSRATHEISRQLVEDFLTWLEHDRNRRFFAYVHLLPPHNPYLPPRELALRFRDPSYGGGLVADTATLLEIDRGERTFDEEDVRFIASQYDANLHFADLLVGTILEGLARLDLLGTTAVIVTSDHGAAFGQHGRFLHSSTLYEEMIRVPLVFRLPESDGLEARRIPEPVALVDLLPTIVDIFHLADVDRLDLDGRSLLPLIEGRTAQLPRRMIFARTLRQVAGIDGQHKLILPTTLGAVEAPELYELREDPDERKNLFFGLADQAARLEAAAWQHVRGTRAEEPGTPERELSFEQKRRLRALGYLD